MKNNSSLFSSVQSHLFETDVSVLGGAFNRLLTMLIDVFPKAKLTLGPEIIDSSRDTICCICVEFREDAFPLRFRRPSAFASALVDESVEAICDTV